MARAQTRRPRPQLTARGQYRRRGCQDRRRGSPPAPRQRAPPRGAARRTHRARARARLLHRGDVAPRQRRPPASRRCNHRRAARSTRRARRSRARTPGRATPTGVAAAWPASARPGRGGATARGPSHPATRAARGRPGRDEGGRSAQSSTPRSRVGSRCSRSHRTPRCGGRRRAEEVEHEARDATRVLDVHEVPAVVEGHERAAGREEVVHVFGLGAPTHRLVHQAEHTEHRHREPRHSHHRPFRPPRAEAAEAHDRIELPPPLPRRVFARPDRHEIAEPVEGQAGVHALSACGKLVDGAGLAFLVRRGRTMIEPRAHFTGQ